MSSRLEATRNDFRRLAANWGRPMTMQRYELKLDDGRQVEWVGSSGEDAARRYVDCCGGTVVAWRMPPVALLVGTSQVRG